MSSDQQQLGTCVGHFVMCCLISTPWACICPSGHTTMGGTCEYNEVYNIIVLCNIYIFYMYSLTFTSINTCTVCTQIGGLGLTVTI